MFCLLYSINRIVLPLLLSCWVLSCTHIFACTSDMFIWKHIDFDLAMQTSEYSKEILITKRIFGVDGTTMLAFYRHLYEKNNPERLIEIYKQKQENPSLKIPKIIHQIWIGGPVPEAFHAYMQTWQDMHPEWDYKLWTDDTISSFMPLYNQSFYDETDSPGVKSDLLKWEIIYRYGGVYVDVDFECLRSLDMFHYLYDFYTALQPLDTQFLQLGAALFAAVPYHPILKECIESIKDDWHYKGAPTKSGPVHFTKAFYRTAGKTNMIDIAFPAFYFYPLGCRDDQLNYDEWIDNGAYAIHHWAKSWMPSHYRLSQFKKLGNEVTTQTWND